MVESNSLIKNSHDKENALLRQPRIPVFAQCPIGHQASGSGKQRFASGSDETSVGSDQADRGFGGRGVGQQANHDYFRGYGSSVGE